MRDITVLLLADTHLGFDDPDHPRVARRRRGPDFFANYRRVLADAERTRPDLVVHGGDFFAHSRVSARMVDEAYRPIAALAEQGVPVVLVPGNHDRSRFPLTLWLAASNVHVIDRPRTVRLRVGGATVAVAGFPFVRRIRERFTDTLAQTGWADGGDDVRLLCMHQTVEGATAGASGYRFGAGRDQVAPADVPDGIAAILSGHMHGHQVLRPRGVNGPPVIYAGSTERTSFAERYERKGFVYLVIGATRSEGWRVRDLEFRELPTRPMVDVDVAPATTAPSLARYLRSRAARLDPDAVVRLTCSGEVDHTVAAALTAPFLRATFPPTMNVQLSVELRERMGGPGRGTTR